MKILVTGASGFVGGALIRGLAAAGWQGIACSRKAMTSLPEDWIWMERNSILSGSVEEVDWIIHLEVKQHVQNPTPADLADFEKVNVDGCKAWLVWADRNEVKGFCLFSTIKASGGSAHALDERDAVAPNTIYGKTKRAAEEAVSQWAGNGTERRALILRPAVVYGPGNTANMYSFVQAIHRGRFFLIGRNDNHKSLISLANLVAATIHLLKRGGTGAELYYLTDGKTYTVSELAAFVCESLRSRRVPRRMPPALAGLIAGIGSLFSSVTGKEFPLTKTRLAALLENTHFRPDKLLATGFNHPQTTQEGLETMVKWYLSETKS